MFFIRKIIVLFWVFIFAAVLYLPAYLPKALEHKVINVLVWPGVFSLKVISEFEATTGINVNISYFESNDELLAKFRATGGVGYDLIIPSDHAVNYLIKADMLKPLDKNRLSFWSGLNTGLLNHYFDPDNKYSVPLTWDIMGLGINRKLTGIIDDPSWKYVFDPKFIPAEGIVITNDPLEAVLVASLYLYGSPKAIDKNKLNHIKQLLLAQKPFVKAYTEYRPDYYLITKNAGISLQASIYIWRSQIEYSELDFVIPKEGSVISIESFAMPKSTKKDDLVYKFINFMLSPKVEREHFKDRTLLPVSSGIVDDLIESVTIKKILNLSRKELDSFYFQSYSYFEKPINEQTIQDLWIQMKTL